MRIAKYKRATRIINSFLFCFGHVDNLHNRCVCWLVHSGFVSWLFTYSLPVRYYYDAGISRLATLKWSGRGSSSFAPAPPRKVIDKIQLQMNLTERPTSKLNWRGLRNIRNEWLIKAIRIRTNRLLNSFGMRWRLDLSSDPWAFLLVLCYSNRRPESTPSFSTRPASSRRTEAQPKLDTSRLLLIFYY